MQSRGCYQPSAQQPERCTQRGHRESAADAGAAAGATTSIAVQEAVHEVHSRFRVSCAALAAARDSEGAQSQCANACKHYDLIRFAVTACTSAACTSSTSSRPGSAGFILQVQRDRDSARDRSFKSQPLQSHATGDAVTVT